MPSHTKYSPLVFSPRPTVVTRPFDSTIAHRIVTVKQDKFSYVVSSDGIEVCHPQAVRNGDPIELVRVEDKNSYAATEAVAVDAKRLSLITDIQDVIKVPPVIEYPSLIRRRGRDIATLDLDREARHSDEDSWTTKTPWTNEASWSARSGNSLADGPRARGVPPIGVEYEIIREIGDDSEGVCTLVKRRTDSGLRVIKSVAYPKIVHGKPIEARILHDLLSKRHDNIIQLYSYEFMEQRQLVQYHLEYCSGGDLHDLIVRYDEHNSRFPEPFIWKVFFQLLSALEYLHRGFEQRTNNGIVHRDVKPENIFLRRSQYSLEYPDVVLADFGSASLEFATYEPAGTYFWQPPEISRKTPKGDVWACGAVIHYMVHLTPPMLALPRGVEPTDRNQERWELMADSRQPIKTVPETYSQELIIMMLAALQREESKRMNSSWLLRVVEGVMDQKPLPGADKCTNAEPLAAWAFDESPPSGGDDGSRRCSRSDDGYMQYIEMMDECYPLSF